MKVSKKSPVSCAHQRFACHPHALQGLEYLDLMSRFSDLAGREVDLVVLNRASAPLRHQVMKHRAPLCVKDRASYTGFREKTMRDYAEYLRVAGRRRRG